MLRVIILLTAIITSGMVIQTLYWNLKGQNPYWGLPIYTESPYGDMTDCIPFPEDGTTVCLDTFDGLFFEQAILAYYIKDNVMRVF